MHSDVEQALALIHRRDEPSVGHALVLLHNTVFSFGMKVCGHREDAEDTAQDVLLKSLPYLAKFDNPQALSVWLYRVARNRCLMNRRGRKYSQKLHVSLDDLMPDGRELKELLESAVNNPEAQVADMESTERLREAVLALPPQYRFVLVLHDMEELNTSEVAKVMGLQEGTVRVRLHRARLLLRREMQHATHTRPAKRRTRSNCRGLFAALSDYLDGLVDDAVCNQMQKHIADCAPCQAFLSSLKSVIAQCHRYSPECPPDRVQRVRIELLQKYFQAQQELQSRAPRKRVPARTPR
jgi:RNA polymerase sigma-70 factor (ECF subfamily)